MLKKQIELKFYLQIFYIKRENQVKIKSLYKFKFILCFITGFIFSSFKNTYRNY